MRSDTVDLDHFEQLYRRSVDPWHYASSAYERAKYRATLEALPQARYSRALDVGCSVGVLTAKLADRCDALVAIEPVEAALAQARLRCADKPWVDFAPIFVPRDWPAGDFDLILISEVLDYLGAEDLAALAARLKGSLRPGGDLVLVHWVGKKRGPPRPDEASAVLIGVTGDMLTIVHQDRNPDYRLDVLHRD